LQNKGTKKEVWAFNNLAETVTYILAVLYFLHSVSSEFLVKSGKLEIALFTGVNVGWEGRLKREEVKEEKSLKIQLFRDMTPCRAVCRHRRFGGEACHHRQGLD
jgi:hypothetical protein